jgi:osmotically-inducible protein OsmY
MMLRFWILLLLTLSVVAQPSATKSTAPKKPPPAQGTTSEQDKLIEAAIKAKLEKSKIGKDGFKVRVQGGVATWEGNTDVLQHKGAATRMAKTAGAKVVVNHIKVSDAAKQKAEDNLDQGRRRVQVKRGDSRSDPPSQ